MEEMEVEGVHLRQLRFLSVKEEIELSATGTFRK